MVSWRVVGRERRVGRISEAAFMVIALVTPTVTPFRDKA